MWLDKSRELATSKERLEREIIELERKKEDQNTGRLDSKAIRDALVKLDDGFDSLPIVAKQTFLRTILSRVTATKDKLILRIKNPGQLLPFKNSLSVNEGVDNLDHWKSGSPVVLQREHFRQKCSNIRNCGVFCAKRPPQW